MSENNGVIRIGKKGIKKFAFGEDGPVFDVDVVVVFQEWITIDSTFRQEDSEGVILHTDMAAYHQAAVDYARRFGGDGVTTAEALDFIARLREQYDELVHFFQPRSREERVSPDTLVAASEMRFSVEEN